MKPELTTELKERFFAQYYNQKCIPIARGIYRVQPSHAKRKTNHIILRPLLSITDEEAIDVAKCTHITTFMSPNYKKWIVTRKSEFLTVSSKFSAHSFTIDFTDGQVLMYNDDDIDPTTESVWAYQKMLSMGFALPFMGHLPDELVKVGWMKFKEPESELIS